MGLGVVGALRGFVLRGAFAVAGLYRPGCGARPHDVANVRADGPRGHLLPGDLLACCLQTLLTLLDGSWEKSSHKYGSKTYVEVPCLQQSSGCSSWACHCLLWAF